MWQVFRRLTRAKRDLVAGLRYGYPVCCVLNYTLDSILGLPGGLSRGERFDSKSRGFVPCHFHKHVLHSLSHLQSMQLLNSGFSAEHLAPEDLIETRVNGRVIASVRVPKGYDAIFLSQIRLQD